VVKIRHLYPRQVLSFLIPLTLLLTAAVAQAAGFRFIEAPAGPDGPALTGAMWSPCSAAPGEIDLGNATLPGAKDCPIASDKLPLVVISHGRGGSFLGHHDIAETLADAGFVVAAINHPGDTASDMSRSDDLSVFTERPSDIKRLKRMGETRAERPFTGDRSCLRASQGGAEPEVAPRSAMRGAPAEGEAEADGQRGEDTHLQGSGRGVRLPGVHVRTDVFTENRPGKKSIRRMPEGNSPNVRLYCSENRPGLVKSNFAPSSITDRDPSERAISSWACSSRVFIRQRG